MYGNYGRRSPSPMRNHGTPLRRGGGRLGIIPPAPPLPPPSEPDRDEAFVQETGIKVFTSLPPRPVMRMAEEAHVEEEEEEEEEEDNHSDDDHDEDGDCYEIIMDDAIIEEDNEDEEDEDDKNQDEHVVRERKHSESANKEKHHKRKNSTSHNYHNHKEETKSNELVNGDEKIPTDETQPGCQEISHTINVASTPASDSQASESAGGLFDKNLNSNNKSSSGVSSNGSSGSVSHTNNTESCNMTNSHSYSLTPVGVDEFGGTAPLICSNGQTNDPPSANVSNIDVAETGSAMSRSISNNFSSPNNVKLSGTLSTSLKGLNQIVTSPTGLPPSGHVSLSAHTTPTKEPTDFLVRGKPGRLSLPLRDRFIARPASQQESNGGQGEPPRTKDGILRPTRTIWFRRSFKTASVSEYYKK